MATSVPAREEDELTPKRIMLVRGHLKAVLASHSFAGSKRAQEFLQLIVGHALEGQFDSLRERMIGVEMFGRPVDYDTGNDPVVRVKATEIRKKLAQYYFEAGGKHPVRIELPSGSYVPRFHFAPLEASAQSPDEAVPLPPMEQAAAPDASLSGEAPQAKPATPLLLSSGRLSRTPRILVASALGLILIAIASYAGFRRSYVNSNGKPEIRSIVILPLENLSGDPDQEYFADGMTEELINDLGQVSTLRVISLTSAMSYKGTKKTLPEIARELAVDGVVEGSVQRVGNQVHVSARLIDARTDHPLWVHTYARDLANVLTLQGELAQAIAEGVSISVTPQTQTILARQRSVNTKAEDLYMRGMLRINANDPHNAIGYFQAAISADPDFAEAHAALADCYGRMGESGMFAYSDAFSKQKAEALKSIELDGSLPEGHAELAEASMNLDWDWANAAKEYNRALTLNPSSAPVHESFGIYLERIGRFTEAIAESERGVELDPVGARSFWNAATAYYFSRKYDQALPLALKAQAMNINIASGSFISGEIYAEKGMYAKAISEFLKLGDSPHVLGHLGNAFARSGQTDSARKIISQLKENVRKNGVGGYEIALIYAPLGEKNEAFTWLEESYATHSYGLEHLKVDPCLDPLRSDRRFDDLLRRVGLTP